MKLAEALLERKRIKDEIQVLRVRAVAGARMQEGDRPPEDPAELGERVMGLADRLEELTAAINRTNMAAKLPDGRTLGVIPGPGGNPGRVTVCREAGSIGKA
ncbi:DIP1984 family protein [Desulfofundulus sp.]|uniref:DIP1984 family protein n=1 Tax=Desulfofundulus sp. TaxID=2282750 RepID=UPI003C72C867